MGVGYTSTDHELQHLGDPPPDQVTVATGSWFEVCCGALGFAFAVIGILGSSPTLMAAIATITVGLGVFAQAGTIASRSDRSEREEVLGITTDLVAGLAAIVLGVLVLLRIAPFAWLLIAAMALGAGLMFAARVEIGGERPGARGSAGFPAMLLTLVAFVVIVPMTTLSLVAVACAGCGLVLAAEAR